MGLPGRMRCSYRLQVRQAALETDSITERTVLSRTDAPQPLAASPPAAPIHIIRINKIIEAGSNADAPPDKIPPSSLNTSLICRIRKQVKGIHVRCNALRLLTPLHLMPGTHSIPYAIFYVRQRTEDRRNETDNFLSIPIAAAGQESSESRLRWEHLHLVNPSRAEGRIRKTP
jgi:hypothetical protein